MRALLRSLVYTDPTQKDQAKVNLGKTKPERLLNLTTDESTLLAFVVDHYVSHAEAPQHQLVYQHFEREGGAEIVALLDELASEQFYDGTSFERILEQEVEDQAAQNLVATCKEAMKIATQGVTNPLTKTTARGTDDAVAHLFSSVRGRPKQEEGRFRASMRKNAQALEDQYLARKNNPQSSYGILTGYGIIDQATGGIRRKQFRLHAGFGGHLKSTQMFNEIVNAAVDGGWNPLLFTTEMPADDVQQLLVAIHCLPARTRILTKRGFKTKDELQPGELVLGHDLKDGTSKWTPVLAINTGVGEVVRMEAKHTNLECTPNHRWVARNNLKGRYSLKETRLLSAEAILLAAPAEGGPLDLSPREAALLGRLATDGAARWTELKGQPHLRWTVQQREGEHPAEFSELTAGISTEEAPHSNGMRKREINTATVRELSAKWKFSTKEDLPSLVTRLTVTARQGLLEAMRTGEINRGGAQRFDEKDGPDLEAYQILCALEGRRTGKPTWTPGDFAKSKAGWTVGHIRSERTNHGRMKKTSLGEQEVWCPTTPLGTWVAELDGQVFITGNSAHPRFNGVGRPLNAFRLLLGALRDDEFKFYKEVKDDLLNNPDHGNIRVVDSSEFTTLGSVMQRTVREHAEEEVDLLWIDYITRMPVDHKYARMDITSARNETLADAKRFAMSFDHGLGLPVETPFQVNREGYKRAADNEGRMTLTALGQYNAAEKEADIVTYIFYDREEKATSEPKEGVLKARYGSVPADPMPLYICPDSRRLFDMSAGMTPAAGYAPTAGGQDEEVAL